MSEEMQAGTEPLTGAVVPGTTPVVSGATPVVSENPASEVKFSQEDLDAAVADKLAKEQRKWEREQTERLQDALAQQAKPKGELKLEQFGSPEEYAQALAEQKADQVLAERTARKAHETAMQAFSDREVEARAKYDDYDRVARNDSLPITPHMGACIAEADNGPDIAYYLGQNVEEARRISKLDPFKQAQAIAKLEVKVAAAPPVKKLTSAPAPLKPVAARGTNTADMDTTHPDSLKKLGTSRWIELDRQRQIRVKGLR